ncbi:MAG TPA: 5'/3'-nucleotidase SurE [Actinobacteria bacterium]|nr:5'/3'-nucleotidase SurE [Actinomycetota bacterium]
MSWILLTNDDGAESPALVPTARALGRLGEVRVVVPASERSWVGKALTRHAPVEVARIERDGLEIWTCTGYPADTVQVAVHALFDEPPRLVVSGINVGYNHGAGFVMSSGTVGAAAEAWTAGLPAVAVSTGTVAGDWPEWRRFVHSPEAAVGWARLADTAVDVVGDVVASGLASAADVVSVNLPFDAGPETPRRITEVARTGYGAVFRGDGDGRFVHGFGGDLVPFAPLDGTDVDAAHRGWISITPLRLPVAAPVDDELRRRLEAPPGR